MSPLRLECYLIPGGNDAAMRPLWHLDIANVTPGRHIADYIVEMLPDGRTAGVFGHRRDSGSEILARDALAAILSGHRDPRQRVPADIVALLEPRTYRSTACRTEQALRACDNPRLLPLVQQYGFPTVTTYADQLHNGCRREDKFIGELCTCPTHAIEVETPV